MIWKPSPNFGERRDGALPDMVVLHYTAMRSARAAVEWLCNPEAQVSAHYVIGRNGNCWQLVEEEMRAWHAGAGAWGSVTDVNSRSIGIELSNTGFETFPEPQLVSLELLLAEIMRRWAIRPERVIGHSDMAPGRKIDPGPLFPWVRLARNGLAVHPDTSGGVRGDGDMLKFQNAVRALGYRNCTSDVMLDAFRRRFRPFAWGPLSAEDVRRAEDLARRYPVDRIVRNA